MTFPWLKLDFPAIDIDYNKVKMGGNKWEVRLLSSPQATLTFANTIFSPSKGEKGASLNNQCEEQTGWPHWFVGAVTVLWNLVQSKCSSCLSYFLVPSGWGGRVLFARRLLLGCGPFHCSVSSSWSLSSSFLSHTWVCCSKTLDSWN